MQNQRSKEIKVGIVTLLGIIILIGGMILGGGINLPATHQLLKIRFPNSGGIQIGEPVVVNGVKRGIVKSVENNSGTVLVKVELNNYNDIMNDATAKLTILEVTGGKKIEINPGISGSRFNLSQEMIGATPPDLAGLVTILGEVSGEAVILVKRLDTITSAATKLLNDESFIGNIKGTLDNTNKLTADLKEILNQNYANINKSLSNLAILTTDLKNAVDKHEPTIGRILSDIETTLANTKNLVTKADTAIANANNLILNVNDIAKEVRNGDGFASKILFDKDLSKKLDSTFNSLSVLLNTIQQHGINVNVRLGTRP